MARLLFCRRLRLYVGGGLTVHFLFLCGSSLPHLVGLLLPNWGLVLTPQVSCCSLSFKRWSGEWGMWILSVWHQTLTINLEIGTYYQTMSNHFWLCKKNKKKNNKVIAMNTTKVSWAIAETVQTALMKQNFNHLNDFKKSHIPGYLYFMP